MNWVRKASEIPTYPVREHNNTTEARTEKRKEKKMVPGSE